MFVCVSAYVCVCEDVFVCEFVCMPIFSYLLSWHINCRNVWAVFLESGLRYRHSIPARTATHCAPV